MLIVPPNAVNIKYHHEVDGHDLVVGENCITSGDGLIVAIRRDFSATKCTCVFSKQDAFFVNGKWFGFDEDFVEIEQPPPTPDVLGEFMDLAVRFDGAMITQTRTKTYLWFANKRYALGCNDGANVLLKLGCLVLTRQLEASTWYTFRKPETISRPELLVAHRSSIQSFKKAVKV